MSAVQQSHFRDWLRNVRLTGCAFAAQFGSEPQGLLFYELLDDVDQLDIAEVADFFDQAAAEHRVSILLGPHIRGDDDTVTLLRILSRHSRWSVAAEPALARDEGEVGVRMTWQTIAGDVTDAMGFAPSAFMPASRRAPYVALAAWTGGHENPRRKQPQSGRVIIGDAPPLDMGRYDATMEKTREWSRKMSAPGEVAREHLRRLTFRLDRRSVERCFPELLA